jgi:hypothetical protein
MGVGFERECGVMVRLPGFTGDKTLKTRPSRIAEPSIGTKMGTIL